MRVLHVLHSLDQRYGGPLRAVLDLSARSTSAELDAELLGFGPLAVPDNPVPPEKIHRLALGFPRAYKYAPGLHGWLSEHLSRFDGVILHGMWLYPNWAVVKACQKRGIPYVCFPHGMIEPWALYGQGRYKAAKKTLYWIFRERSLFQNAAAVFFTTERERTLAQATFLPPTRSLIVVPYGVDELAKPSDEPLSPGLVVPPNRKLALFLGRVHPKKNVEFLLHAWSRSGPSMGWQLVIAGPSEAGYRAVLEAMVAKLGVQDSVRFVGAVSGQDKAYLFGRASWFVLPSKQENFGISVLEAINAGCPVAISNQVYLADSFHSGSEVLPLEMSSWVEFFRDRMPDEAHRQKLISLDREYLVPQFAMDVVTRKWSATILEVFSGPATLR